MANRSPLNKITLSLATVLVLFGIMALYTGAQKPADKPVATPAAAADVKKAAPVIAKTEAPAPVIAKTVAGKTLMAAVAPVAAAGPTAAEVASYLEAYGWMVGQQAGFEMGFTAEEKTALLKGLQSAADGATAPADMKEIFPKMQEYLTNKEKAYRAKLAEKAEADAKVHRADGEKFMQTIVTQPGVQKTTSGLYYKITTVGTGKKPAADDVVSIHYTGKLIDGTVFDSSIERGQPVDLPLYGVIPGFSEGLQLLNEGGKATLYIPADLGYGNQAAGPIPAGSTLVFDVELIKIQPKPAAPEAPTAADIKLGSTEAPKAEVKTEVKAEVKASTQK